MIVFGPQFELLRMAGTARNRAGPSLTALLLFSAAGTIFLLCVPCVGCYEG